MAFVHLRVHSSFSRLDSALTPKQIAKAAAKAGMSAVALTDSGHVAGAIEFGKAVASKGLRPIYGALFGLYADTPIWREGGVGAARMENEPGGLLLYAETLEGWENLCRLSSIAQTQMQARPRVRWSDLDRHRGGLRALVPFDGTWTLPDDIATCLDALWPGRWGLERFDHGIGWEPEMLDRRDALARRAPYGWVGTNAVRHLDPLAVVDLVTLRAIGIGATLDEPGDWRPVTDQAFFADEAEMRDRLGDAACDAAVAFAEGCVGAPKTGTYHFPRSEPPEELVDPTEQGRWLQTWFPLPVSVAQADAPIPTGATVADAVHAWLVEHAQRGLAMRLGRAPELDPAPYQARLDRELAMIRTMGFSAYMLIVAEFIVWSKQNGVPVGPGRGSVAGSLVAWALQITEVDSIRFKLLFERFLNPARVSMPDVDVDFGQVRREDAIEHMRVRYGEAHVGQISNFGKFKPRSALTDVLRGLRMSFPDQKRLTGAMDDEKAVTLTVSLQSAPLLTARARLDPLVHRAIRLATRLLGEDPDPTKKPDPFVRQYGVHAAGVVVAPRPLDVYAPVWTDPDEGRRTLAVDMDGVETLGLIKFDFLGLKTLDILEEALDHVEAQTGVRPDLDRMPLNDPQVFALLSQGDVQGLFQVESDGMRTYLQQLQPDSIEDIIAMLALYRPGPLGSGMVEDFIERKRGRQEVVHLHPLLAPVLADTYGVLVYQESILQAAQVLAGYSLGHADLLRRAIGKKKKEEIDAQKATFVDGCAKNGIERPTASRIFEMIEKFAEYGFNRSHSAAYGLITYRTAWLKAHHRAAFGAATLSWAQGDQEATAALSSDLARAQIPILGPEIAQSQARCSLEATDTGLAIRIGLGAIKGLGAETLSGLFAARAEAPFSDPADLVVRAKLNKTAVRVLAHSGALDRYQEPREAIPLHVEAWQKGQKAAEKEDKKAIKKATKKGSTPPAPSLFSALPDPPVPTRIAYADVRVELPWTERWTWQDQVQAERAVLGSVVHTDPLARVRPFDELVRTHTLFGAQGESSRTPLSLVGSIAFWGLRKTKTGQRMGDLSIEDRSGRMDGVLWADALARAPADLAPGQIVWVRGQKDRPGPGGVLIVQSLERIDDIRRRRGRLVHIGRVARPLPDPEGLYTVLTRHPGRCPLRIHGADPVWTARLSALQIDPDAACFDDLERWFRWPEFVRVIG